MVATFVRWGYQTAQEVKIDLLLFFETSQNHTGIDDKSFESGKITIEP